MPPIRINRDSCHQSNVRETHATNQMWGRPMHHVWVLLNYVLIFKTIRLNLILSGSRKPECVLKTAAALSAMLTRCDQWPERLSYKIFWLHLHVVTCFFCRIFSGMRHKICVLRRLLMKRCSRKQKLQVATYYPVEKNWECCTADCWVNAQGLLAQSQVACVHPEALVQHMSSSC